MEFESWLESKGFALDTLSVQQRSGLEAVWRAEQNPAPAPTPDKGGEQAAYDALMESFRQEQAREREITALAAAALRDHPEASERIDQIVKLAFAGKWSPKDTELALLRGLRTQAPAPLSRNGREVTPRVLEAALAMSAGLSEEQAVAGYGAATLEQAHAAFRGGLSLGELIVGYARRNGYADASIRGSTVETLRAAFRQPVAAGFSNVSLPGIFSNLANKFIREGFDYVDASWRDVCAVRSTNDFKQVTTYGLVGDYDFVEVAKDGRIPHAVPGELDYTNQVKLYARMLTLTYVDLINDDLGAMNQKGKKLGGGAGRAWCKKFWTKWNTLANFNTVGLGNFASGADTAFDADALDTAVQLFRDQKVPSTDGSTDSADPLGVRPRKLVVPPKFHMAALRLMRSQKVNENSTGGDDNPWSGMFDVVAPDYMHETSLGGTLTRWSLIADPNELPCIEAAFLFGKQAPTIENVDVDADQLGIGMRGFWANGVELQERRGRVVMAGA